MVQSQRRPQKYSVTIHLMRNILKQTSWLFLAQSLTRIISFFYIIYLARILGVEDFGLFNVALAYFSIISSIADFGFNRFLIREMASDKSKAAEIVWNVCMLRLTLASLLFAVFAVILYSLDPDKMRVTLVLLASLAILPQAVALTLDGIFVGIQKLQFSAISLLLASLSTTLAGLYLVGRGFGAIGAVNALIFGQTVYVLALLFFLKRHHILSLSHVRLSTLKKVIIGSLPYGILSVLGLLYFRIDAILLSYLRGSFETGLYGAAYKFLEAVIFIPTAFSYALFPVMAKLHEDNPLQIKKLYFKSLKVMGILGLLVLSGYLLIIPTLIKIFLPSYILSIPALVILSLAIPFMFIHTPSVQVLLSTDKYLKPVVLLSFLTLSFNIVLNLIFIPLYGFIGASMITVASEISSFVVFFLLVKNKILDQSK